MAGSIQLTWSTGTIDLQNTAGSLDFTYTPTGAHPSQDYVTEQGNLRIQVIGTATAFFGAVMGSINRAFELARNWNAGEGGDRVFLQMRPYGYPDLWRSEIIDGYITPPDGALDANRWEGTTGLRKLINFPVSFTRRNYFEGTLTELPITNTNGTNATGGTLKVYNNCCGTGAAGSKQVNYFDVAGAAISGELPAYVQLVTAVGSAGYIKTMYVGESVWANPALGDPAGARPLNTEYNDATTLAGVGTSYADTASSGGTAIHGATETGIDWHVLKLRPNTYGMDLNNSWHRVLMRAGGPGTYNFQISVGEGGQGVAETRTVALPYDAGIFNYVMLDTFRLPISNTSYNAGSVDVTVIWSTKSGTAPDIDFLQFFGADCYRQVDFRLYASIVGSLAVNIDEINREYMTCYLSSGTINNYYESGGAYGSPLTLYPGSAARFYMAWDSGSYNGTANLWAFPRLYYRPRRLTL